MYRVSGKKWYLMEKRPLLPTNSSNMQKFGVIWKIQDITILHELLQCISKHTTLFDQTNLFRDTVWATLQWKSRKTD